jgi:FKBP-type peptidyl-prolyl cis-trans isomerase
MAQKRVRIFTGFMAGLFLVTSCALTIGVIWQSVQDSKTSKNNASKGAHMLQGTKLANFTPMSSIPALKTEDTTPGTGEAVKATDTVTVDYTGAVAATGIIFQSSKDTGQPVSFPLNQVIPGWTQGMPGMKTGGTRRLFIPAALAYGATPPQGSGIPANADLVFDVTLHKIGK